MTPNVAGMLAYILGFVTGILFLLVDPYKNDRFVRFHAFQSIFFNLAVIAFFIAWGTVSSILISITGGLLALVIVPITMLVYLGVFVYWIFLMYKAYKNERYMIPYIGEMAARQSG